MRAADLTYVDRVCRAYPASERVYPPERDQDDEDGPGDD